MSIKIKKYISQHELLDIVKNYKSINDIIDAINHPSADDTIYLVALKIAIDLSYESKNKICMEIVKTQNISASTLEMVIKAVPTCNVVVSAINNDKCDKKVLEAAIEISGRYISESKNAILSAVIDCDKVDSELLEKVIDTKPSANVIKKAVYSSNSDSSVWSKAIEKSVNYEESGKGIIGMSITQNIRVSSEDLVKLVYTRPSAHVIVGILGHPNTDEKVLSAIISIINCYLRHQATQILDAIVQNKAVTKKILSEVIKVSSSDVIVLVRVIRHPLTDKTILDEVKFVKNNMNVVSRHQIENEIEKIEKTLESNPNVKIVDNDDEEEPKEVAEVNDEVEGNEMKVIIEKEDNVTERIRRNVEDGMSTMLWGLSGIGKTSRVREIDPNFTMIKLKNDMLPEEVTGGKEPNGEPGQMYPPKWYVKLCKKCQEEPDKMHILFIDELTNVKNNVKSLVWDIIEDRRVNGDEDWELPDNCAIVAAGNRPEESTSVITDYNGGVLPEPLHDRFDFHIEIPLDMNEWQQWALETNKKTGNLNIHPIVLSFCVPRADKVMFSSMDISDVTKPRLSPRRWEKLSKAIYTAEKRGGKNCRVSNQRIAECIGSDLATAFIAHYQRKPLDMKKVEDGRYSPNEFKNIEDKLYAISSLIAEYQGSEMAVIDFIETCLGDDYVALYNVMKNQDKGNVLEESSSEELLESSKTM